MEGNMLQFTMQNDGAEVDLRLRVNMPALIFFLRRLTALVGALTALVGALLGWW